jgi:signal transduction histidine kinase
MIELSFNFSEGDDRVQYIIIGLTIVVILLFVQSYLLYHALTNVCGQMDDIEKHPERNRQLKVFLLNHRLEELLKRINQIYQARQQERIVYQRRETQIRQEIENISHDLRTPLTSIMGYIELMKDKDTPEGEKEEYLDIILRRARVLQGFIQDFYEISRIEGEDYPFLLDGVLVQSIIGEAVVAYFHEFEKKNILVNIELEEAPCMITADKIQFNRILNNLIQNAIKYAKKNFIVRQYTRNGKCTIKFMNDKNTITEEEIVRIFDRFYTGDQSRGQGSSGLGLTITRLLVEKMKGTIEARLEEEMFVIELNWPMRS